MDVLDYVIMLGIWGTVIIMSFNIINCMNQLHNITLDCFKTANCELRFKRSKDTYKAIDDIRNKVLYSAETYEPNDVLDIIDEITEIMQVSSEFQLYTVQGM